MRSLCYKDVPSKAREMDAVRSFLEEQAKLVQERQPAPKKKAMKKKASVAASTPAEEPPEEEATRTSEEAPAFEVEEAVEFADASERPSKDQLFENVFADPSGFGIAADGGSQNPF